jgi:hypothetical protein
MFIFGPKAHDKAKRPMLQKKEAGTPFVVAFFHGSCEENTSRA